MVHSVRLGKCQVCSRFPPGADLDAAGSPKVAEEVIAGAGGGRAIGVGMDVTQEASVRAGFEGIDLLDDRETTVAGHTRDVIVDATGRIVESEEEISICDVSTIDV
jgi:hypothetical protein